MERIEAPVAKRKAMKLAFPPAPRSGRVVIELADVSFGYEGNLVYDGLDFVMERQDKVALVGPNGAGKSTLLKLVAGVLQPQAGERKLGHNVKLGYFAQHQIESLQAHHTVLQELSSAVAPGTDVDARKLLGRFLFSGDDADKRVGVLSGGERTRLAIAKLLVSPINLLCMDEPTNHLDMWSRDILEEALQEYTGAIVLITHDRHLIRSIGNRIVEVDAGRVTSYIGDYDYYLSKKEQSPERPAARMSQAPVDRGSGPKTKEQKRLEAEARSRTRSLRDRVVEIERQLDELGAELQEFQEMFASPEFYMSGADVGNLTQRYESARRRAGRLEAAWAEAMEALEAAEG
jgi:ATP-binding cassette subfamily F protein 3